MFHFYSSLHLCEAPGGFVNAIADYMASHHIVKYTADGKQSDERLTPADWQWKAASLNYVRFFLIIA